MKRPQKIKVGYRTYKVKKLDPISATDYFGRHSAGQGIIVLQRDADKEVAANTMLHELVHAINAVWHEGEEQEISEAQVAAQANGLQTIWRDNPTLFRWLHRKICG